MIGTVTSRFRLWCLLCTWYQQSSGFQQVSPEKCIRETPETEKHPTEKTILERGIPAKKTRELKEPNWWQNALYNVTLTANDVQGLQEVQQAVLSRERHPHESQWKYSVSISVIPGSRSGVLLEKFHDSAEVGHPGRDEIYQSICRCFFFEHVQGDYWLQNQRCYICACTKASNQKASSSMQGRQPHRPWEVVTLDLMGPYHRTSRSKTEIPVVTDLFIQWLEAFTIPEATINRIVTILRNKVFSHYTYPWCLMRNNGSQFASWQWQQMITSWGVQHWTTPIYSLQANPTEWQNQELIMLLGIYLVSKEHKMWDLQLTQALFALRQQINCVTSYLPVELFLGRQLYRADDWNLTED